MINNNCFEFKRLQSEVLAAGDAVAAVKQNFDAAYSKLAEAKREAGIEFSDETQTKLRWAQRDFDNAESKLNDAVRAQRDAISRMNAHDCSKHN